VGAVPTTKSTQCPERGGARALVGLLSLVVLGMLAVWPAMLHGAAEAVVESIWAVFVVIYIAVLVVMRKSKQPG
jgi:hypothetical protein